MGKELAEYLMSGMLVLCFSIVGLTLIWNEVMEQFFIMPEDKNEF